MVTNRPAAAAAAGRRWDQVIRGRPGPGGVPADPEHMDNDSDSLSDDDQWSNSDEQGVARSRPARPGRDQPVGGVLGSARRWQASGGGACPPDYQWEYVLGSIVPCLIDYFQLHFEYVAAGRAGPWLADAARRAASELAQVPLAFFCFHLDPGLNSNSLHTCPAHGKEERCPTQTASHSFSLFAYT